jgi:3-hydroxybutyryl-CoA dehydrogenase
MNLQNIGVIGAGTMGNGIAQVCALAGFNVTLLDISESALQKAVATVGKNLDRQIAKENLTPEQKLAALDKIRTSTDYSSLRDVQLVIEAATENLELKLRVLQQIAAQVGAECVIASNTSSLSITQLAASVSQPERFIGLHFFNPVPVMGLIEVIRGLQTSDATHALALDMATTLGKTAITAGNRPGFVVNRILVPMINEAILVFQEGLASAEDIDAGMRLGCNQPIGPLALADLIGLDTLLAIMKRSTKASTTANTARRHCSRKWSPPVTWDAKRGAASMPMPERCSRFAEYRDKVLELFASKGFGQVGMRELATCLGLSPGSLYHHYPSKQHLLLDLIEEFYEELLATLGRIEQKAPAKRDRLNSLIRAHLNLHREMPWHFRLVERDSGCLNEEQQARVRSCASNTSAAVAGDARRPLALQRIRTSWQPDTRLPHCSTAHPVG